MRRRGGGVGAVRGGVAGPWARVLQAHASPGPGLLLESHRRLELRPTVVRGRRHHLQQRKQRSHIYWLGFPAVVNHKYLEFTCLFTLVFSLPCAMTSPNNANIELKVFLATCLQCEGQGTTRWIFWHNSTQAQTAVKRFTRKCLIALHVPDYWWRKAVKGRCLRC